MMAPCKCPMMMSSTNRIKKKSKKQEALKLASERNHLREMDPELHQKRLELLEHAK